MAPRSSLWVRGLVLKTLGHRYPTPQSIVRIGRDDTPAVRPVQPKSTWASGLVVIAGMSTCPFATVSEGELSGIGFRRFASALSLRHGEAKAAPQPRGRVMRGGVL